MSDDLIVVDDNSAERMPVAANNQAAAPSPFEMMSSLFEKGVDLDKIEKMLELQERFEANQAKKAYFAAVAEFKKSPPKIIKDKTVDYTFGGTRTFYKHADLGRAIESIDASLSPHGLSTSFKQAQDSGNLTITCLLTHSLGYSESTSLTAAYDKSGGKNNIQSIGSADKYLKRYTLFALLGLDAQDEDDDGRASEQVYMNEKQISTITDMMNAKCIDSAAFFLYLQIKSLEVAPASMYGRIVADIENVVVNP